MHKLGSLAVWTVFYCSPSLGIQHRKGMCVELWIASRWWNKLLSSETRTESKLHVITQQIFKRFFLGLWFVLTTMLVQVSQMLPKTFPCCFQSLSMFHCFAPGWHPPLKGKGARKIYRFSWWEGMIKVIGSIKAYKVLLVNCTLDIEIDVFVPDLSLWEGGSGFWAKG